MSDWTILRKFRGTGRHYMADAQCSCGTLRTMRADAITTGKSKSCGCKKGQKISEAFTVHGGTLNNPKEYKTWKEMRQRCLNPSNHKYKDYGARGISICKEWDSFSVFLKDMGERPEGKTLGRINNDGNYEPSNCQWETPLQQANNTRRNILIEHEGKSQTVSQWSAETGIKAGTIQKRFHSGKTPSQILNRVGI
jgi:hypothetical protein